MCDLTGLFIFCILVYGLYFSCLFKKYKLLAFLMLLSIISAVFRGNSGIDTLLYINRFNSINWENINLVEPITQLLMLFSKSISNNFELFTLMHSALVSALYFYIFIKYKNMRYFFISIFPVLYIDSIFNGLRVGLAYPLVILSILRSSNFYYFLAILSHVSALLAVNKNQIKKISIIFIIFLILLLLMYDYESYIDRYSSKYFQYLEITTINVYSGIADFSMLLLISFVFFVRDKKSIFIYFFAFLPLLLIVFSLLNKYVFFIRILRLAGVILFSYSALSVKHNEKHKKMFFYLFSLFGFIYSANFVRQISNSCHHPINGFLPLG